MKTTEKSKLPVSRKLKPPSSLLLRTFALGSVIFLTVSGGPYGLEPLMQYAGRNGALLLLLIVPLLWDVPTILAVLELNSMMPEEGGYYLWVHRALGRRCAFYEGWWSWLYSFADLAIYPVLAVTYLSYFSPHLQDHKIAVCLAIVWGCALLNITGIVNVGKTSVALGAIIILPFLVMFFKAFMSGAIPLSLPPQNLSGIGISSLGLGIYTVMWNFLGWDNVTTYAGEVKRPVRTYLVSIAVSFVLILLVYFFTVLITLNSSIDFGRLNDSGFPLLGEKLGGPYLGKLIAAGGIAMAIGVFSAVMLSISRVPAAMAADRLMPAFLSKLHPVFKTPYLTIIICAAVVSCLSVFTLPELIVMDVLLYGAGLLLEFISLVVLRIKEPEAERPFRIPLNSFLLSAMLFIPVLVFGIALYGILSKPESRHGIIWVAPAALLSAEIAWQALKKIKKQSPPLNSYQQQDD